MRFLYWLTVLLTFSAPAFAIDFRVVPVDISENPTCLNFQAKDLTSQNEIIGECSAFDASHPIYLASWNENSGYTSISSNLLPSSEDRMVISEDRVVFAAVLPPINSTFTSSHASILWTIDLKSDEESYLPALSAEEFDPTQLGMIDIRAFNENGEQIFLFDDFDPFTRSPVFKVKNGELLSRKLSVNPILFKNGGIHFNGIPGNSAKKQTGKFCESFTSKCQFLGLQRFKGSVFASIGNKILLGTLTDINANKASRPTQWKKNNKGRWRYQFLNLGKRILRIMRNNIGITAATATNENGWIGGGIISNRRYNGPFLWIPSNESSASSRLVLNDLSRTFNKAVKELGYKPRQFRNGKIKAISDCGSFIFETQLRSSAFFDFLFIPDNGKCEV